ncbi:Nse4 C-terminal-domain-containing protein [Mycena sp. CBHHK59/15]|nr:Nse4 C-terminal-domain-containing protein [Mycena sp. CBHHK59/15]
MSDSEDSARDNTDRPNLSRAGGDDLPYDPDQDAEEKRAVRRSYRMLHKTFENPNPADYTVEELRRGVAEADKIFEKVKNPQEATLDSSFFVKTTTINSQKARAMKSGTGTFDVEDFITKLVGFMGGNRPPEDPSSDVSDAEEDDAPLEWKKIGRRALAKSRRVPAMGFMLGPLSIEQKQRASNKQRAKFEKDKKDITRPQELKEEDIARSENETTKNVATVAAVLSQVVSINIFRLVVNPESFAQSVENIFYLSFLIRDAQATFQITDDGEPIVFACEEPSDEDLAEGLLKRQLIFEFDMKTWKRAIEVFQIKKPFIPTRPPAKTKLGNKWYG